MKPRIGSLFSGAGGLDLAVEHVFGGKTVWHSEVDPAASKVLAHRWPGVPNLGDITQIDWATVQPVDVLCGGFPCQDLSAAGKRAGIKTGTRSGLWSYYAEAIDTLRPEHVVIENVRGLLSGRAHRDMERCDPIVGDNPDGFVLRAAGAVLGDLADIGYDCRWATVSAASVGAPHRRERVFILASDTQRMRQQLSAHHPRGREPHTAGCCGGCESEGQGTALSSGPKPVCAPTDNASAGGEAFSGRPWTGNAGRLQPVECGSEDRTGRSASDSSGDGRHGRRPEPTRLERGFDAALSGAGPVDLLPTPIAGDALQCGVSNTDRGAGKSNLSYEVAALLPMPTSRDHKGPNQRQDDTCLHGALLPTPNASDGTGGGMHPDRPGREGHSRQLIDYALLHNTTQWGKYGPAISRWEQLTRPAPSPTEPNTRGNPRLNPAFSEWMMGWPQGWVTQVPEISRNDQLRIIGNGVVDRAAMAALRYLLAVCSDENPGACSEQARDATD